MDARVEKLATPKECEIFARNARERNRDDLAEEAKHRAITLNAIAYGAETEAERECLEAVYAYEQILSANNGKPTKASKIWPIVRRHGILVATERALDRKDDAAGYDVLKDAGLEKYAFEAVILRHPELFSEAAVEQSEDRMTQVRADAEASTSEE